MKKQNYEISYEIVANDEKGRVFYVEPGSLELLDSTICLAYVMVVSLNGHEIARDRFVKKEDWKSKREFLKQHNINNH